jgi:hypothetical protein
MVDVLRDDIYEERLVSAKDLVACAARIKTGDTSIETILKDVIRENGLKVTPTTIINDKHSTSKDYPVYTPLKISQQIKTYYLETLGGIIDVYGDFTLREVVNVLEAYRKSMLEKISGEKYQEKKQDKERVIKNFITYLTFEDVQIKILYFISKHGNLEDEHLSVHIDDILKEDVHVMIDKDTMKRFFKEKYIYVSRGSTYKRVSVKDIRPRVFSPITNVQDLNDLEAMEEGRLSRNPASPFLKAMEEGGLLKRSPLLTLPSAPTFPPKRYSTPKRSSKTPPQLPSRTTRPLPSKSKLQSPSIALLGKRLTSQDLNVIRRDNVSIPSLNDMIERTYRDIDADLKGTMQQLNAASQEQITETARTLQNNRMELQRLKETRDEEKHRVLSKLYDDTKYVVDSYIVNMPYDLPTNYNVPTNISPSLKKTIDSPKKMSVTPTLQNKTDYNSRQDLIKKTTNDTTISTKTLQSNIRENVQTIDDFTSKLDRYLKRYDPSTHIEIKNYLSTVEGLEVFAKEHWNRLTPIQRDRLTEQFRQLRKLKESIAEQTNRVEEIKIMDKQIDGMIKQELERLERSKSPKTVKTDIVNTANLLKSTQTNLVATVENTIKNDQVKFVYNVDQLTQMLENELMMDAIVAAKEVLNQPNVSEEKRAIDATIIMGSVEPYIPQDPSKHVSILKKK